MSFSASCAFNIDPLRLANIRILFELFGCLLVRSHVSVIEVAAVTIMPQSHLRTLCMLCQKKAHAFSTAVVALSIGIKCLVAFS